MLHYNESHLENGIVMCSRLCEVLIFTVGARGSPDGMCTFMESWNKLYGFQSHGFKIQSVGMCKDEHSTNKNEYSKGCRLLCISFSRKDDRIVNNPQRWEAEVHLRFAHAYQAKRAESFGWTSKEFYKEFYDGIQDCQKKNSDVFPLFMASPLLAVLLLLTTVLLQGSAQVGTEKLHKPTLEMVPMASKIFSRGFNKAKIPSGMDTLDLIGEKVRSLECAVLQESGGVEMGLI